MLIFNPNLEKRAEEILIKAVELSPTNQQGWWQLAEVNVVQGKIDQAIPYLERALEIYPRVGRAHWYLAMGYKISGDYELALKEMKMAKENGYNWANSTEDFQRVADTLDILNIDFFSYFGEPDSVNAWMNLAASYANLGRYDKARKTAEMLREVNPDTAPRVEEFLKSLPQ